MTYWVAGQQRLIAYLGIGYTHHTADSYQATRRIQLDMVTRQNDRVTHYAVIHNPTVCRLTVCQLQAI